MLDLKDAQEGIQFANSKFAEITDGQKALITGMEGLLKGISDLETGLDKMALGKEKSLIYFRNLQVDSLE